jgi:ZIP family zinc transporter
MKHPRISVAASSTFSTNWSLRRCAGLAIVIAGAAVLCARGLQGSASHDPRLSGALYGGLVAALATALGTLPVMFSQQFTQRTYDTMLGFGAGVMLAACSFSLVLPALHVARLQGLASWGAAGIVGGAICLGAVLLLGIDRVLPHEHFVKGVEGPHARALKRVWLFVLAIVLHNLPEGLAIGVAFAGTDPVSAAALTTGIAIQDVPEGMVVALALRSVGYGRGLSVALGILSGLVEPVAAAFGAVVMTISAALLPWGLGMAAGAMLFVISHEIIPESHRQGHEAHATSGLILGFIVMMVLYTALG